MQRVALLSRALSLPLKHIHKRLAQGISSKNSLLCQSRCFSTSVSRYVGALPKNYPSLKYPENPIMEDPKVIPPAKKINSHPGASQFIQVPMGTCYDSLRIPTSWLRDACSCPTCVNPDSGQKTFGSVDVENYPIIEMATRTMQSGLRVLWRNGGLRRGNIHEGSPHESIYSWEFLASLAAGIPSDFTRYRQWHHEWMGKNFDPHVVSYGAWVAQGEAFEDALLALDSTGILFIKGVPSNESSVESVATTVGNMYETFYGRTWDVRSKPRAENVAYTNEFLGLHQDLLYKAEVPRIQFLHCLENSCQGGESLFSDGRTAARRLHILEYRALENWRVTYGYQKNGNWYERQRYVFEGDLDAKTRSMKRAKMYQYKPIPHFTGDPNDASLWKLGWSPPFQVRQINPTQYANGFGRYRNWLKAARKFSDYLEDPDAVYEYRMQPGDCVVFDNWRIVHGRRQFDVSSGARWLRGTYIDHQAFDSKVRLALRNRESRGLWLPQDMPDYKPQGRSFGRVDLELLPKYQKDSEEKLEDYGKEYEKEKTKQHVRENIE